MRFSPPLLVIASVVSAETGLDGWLRYARLPNAERYLPLLPERVVTSNATDGSPIHTAGEELRAGVQSIFGKIVTTGPGPGPRPRLGHGVAVITVVDKLNSTSIPADTVPALSADGFWLQIKAPHVSIVGQNERGALHGTFEYLSMLAQGNVSDVCYASNPDAPIRWINQWDNLRADASAHGSVERGYAGPSIFFENGLVRQNLTRVAQYARLLASIGVNAVVVNNVNSNESFLTDRVMDGLKRVADTMRPYGVQMGLSLYFASPKALGDLNTFDPLDQTVIRWWQNKTDALYSRIPDMAGYLIKANSEGQPGPLTYNRTLAEGANLFARALKPHGGVVMFRAFVYNSKTLNQTTNWKADRANAAVDFFKELDGEFDDNVVVQVKYGPIDFQVREPVSPLFSHLRQTASAIELQISQEYLGQQCHLVYLPPLWHTILHFDLRVDSQPSLTRDIIAGRRFHHTLGGYAGVANVGMNQTWLGSHLAMSNLYAFGRLAWTPTRSSASILDDWTRLTFGLDPVVLDTISALSMDSWRTYENYTGNLGVQTLTDIIYGHYGPNPASQDGNPWGQWTRADGTTIGMDRTVKNGTGFAGQYPAEVAEMFENVDTTEDDLLLWFHHVPYTQRLKSGQTVIQHFYDSHYAGAERAQQLQDQWQAVEGKIDSQRFKETLFRLEYQAGHSLVWRDAVNDFYHNLSGIVDEKQRVGNHPYRIEAEDMDLDGYAPYVVSPWNTASGGVAVVTATNTTEGSISTVLEQETGRYDVAVNYFDMAIGRSTWELHIGGDMVATWKGDSDLRLGHAPSNYIDGSSASRKTFRGLDIDKGDVLKVVGRPDGLEPAPIDYISILPEGTVD